MNLSTAETIVGSKTTGDRSCYRCGAQPKLIIKFLDSRRGCTVRMFECVCGERIWAEDLD